MNKDQSNIVLGTATPDIDCSDLQRTNAEFLCWMEQIDQATPVTPAVTANATYVLDYK